VARKVYVKRVVELPESIGSDRVVVMEPAKFLELMRVLYRALGLELSEEELRRDLGL